MSVTPTTGRSQLLTWRAFRDRVCRFLCEDAEKGRVLSGGAAAVYFPFRALQIIKTRYLADADVFVGFECAPSRSHKVVSIHVSRVAVAENQYFGSVCCV